MRIDNPRNGIVSTAIARADMPKPDDQRDPRIVAKALADAARELGLSAEDNGFPFYGMDDLLTVRCEGRRRTPGGGPDVVIEFRLGKYGDMEGAVLRGMENFGQGPQALMHKIVANACRKTGIFFLQNSNAQINSILAMEPNFYSGVVQQRGLKADTFDPAEFAGGRKKK